MIGPHLMAALMTWRTIGIVALVATAWWWHTSAVRTAAAIAEKAAHAHYAAILADLSDQAQKAAKAFRKSEQEAQAAIEKEASNGQKKIDAARADATAAHAAAVSLRQQLQHYRADARASAHPGTAPAGPPAGDALDLLADLFSRADDAAGQLAAAADMAHAAGATCERAYDEVRKTLNNAQAR